MGDILAGIFGAERDARGRRINRRSEVSSVQEIAEPIAIVVPEPDVLLGVVTLDTSDVPEFDPSSHTVAEVLDYAAAHPDEVPAIVAAEQAGKARKMVLALS